MDRCPIGADGTTEIVGHIASREQAERWQAAGYNISMAVDRYVEMIARWEAAKDEDAADMMMRQFYAREAEIAANSGVPESDPDFWRFASAPKHHEWA